MRTVCFTAFMLLIPAFLWPETPLQKQKKTQSRQVEEQRTDNLQRKNELIQKMKSFMDSINGRLDKDSRIVIPVNPDDAVDFQDDDRLFKEESEKKEYAYVAVKDGKLRNAAGEVTDTLNYGERVLVIHRIDFKGVAAVRRLTEDAPGEGWVYLDILQSKKPKELNSAPSYIVPTEGRISGRFGTRSDPFKKSSAFHKGVDIAAPSGTPVYAAANGTVARSEFNGSGYGNLIVIDHGGSLSTYYAHLESRGVKKGTVVSQGELIGKVGKTGRATGSHLHFEVRRGGSALNPEEFFPSK